MLVVVSSVISTTNRVLREEALVSLCHLTSAVLVISTSGVDFLERLVSKVVNYVSTGMLNSARSLTRELRCCCAADARRAQQRAETLPPSGGPRGERERQGQSQGVRRQIHVQVPRRVSPVQLLAVVLLCCRVVLLRPQLSVVISCLECFDIVDCEPGTSSGL